MSARRFYTVSATLGLCMEAAAEHHLKMIVLDRPNPITGLIVDGPIADADKLGFTAYTLCPSHGMTMGELATYYNGELKIGCDLTVVRCENWKRAMWWDETNLAVGQFVAEHAEHDGGGCFIRGFVCWSSAIFRWGAGRISRSRFSAGLGLMRESCRRD